MGTDTQTGTQGDTSLPQTQTKRDPETHQCMPVRRCVRACTHTHTENLKLSRAPSFSLPDHCLPQLPGPSWRRPLAEAMTLQPWQAGPKCQGPRKRREGGSGWSLGVGGGASGPLGPAAHLW